jgi:hypothetical protein
MIGSQIATRASVYLPDQRLARLPGNHAGLGQFSERNDYLDVVKHIWDITGPKAIGKGCIIAHEPSDIQIE